ncbi:hypothetical protein B0H67DRAFT_645624 [Lasiosphaeris hirsuta]|uniref:ubiquitinyl hydrolase 1 n=1 Tax=Lasiosphaeris hirsuta TaxID=260670 RepID=A0AA40DTP9_9PEZI|nr:hypothetical protein B0H67DRAFT_645624 [Lasiosphaeris hirsuta]
MAINLLARDGARLDTPTLDFIIHHVFLPPRLPQEDDTNGQHQLAMAQALCDSISDFMVADHRSSPSLQPALEMLGRFLKTNPGLDLSKTNTPHRAVLRSVISNLKDGDVALLHLLNQNAGLLLTSRQDSILFETFELLAPNRHVMSCKGSLLREFPDRAATVPLIKLGDAALLDELVDVIRELELKVAPAARPKVAKAKTAQPEERDTLSPMIATGLLTDVLVGLGREVDPVRITKRSREQVCYDKAFLPFHRSPTWLLLRVALRLVLDRLALSNGEKSWYKPLMAYHHARVLDIAVRAATHPLIPSDKLFSMGAKLVRRITKLDPAEGVCSGWLVEVRETVMRLQATLKERWANMRDEDDQILPLDALSELSFCQDSELKLRGLCTHLSWIESRYAGQRNGTEQGDATRFRPLPCLELPSLSIGVPEDAVAGRCELAGLEAWVESSLPGWSESNHPSADIALGGLKDLIDAYHTRALVAYDGIPGALSIMYMVILELWIAMDKIAGKKTPLLLDYDPGFPPDMSHLLLLERREEMGRLNTVENYLSLRRARAPNPYQSAFSGFGRDESFAVRFYRTSAEHQRLRREIEAWGSAMETKKLQEYEEKRAKHSSLAAAYNATCCEYYWSQLWQEETHSSGCARCRLEREMANLKIEVSEWPLPGSSSHADAAVFEISVPRAVALWRDVTWRLVAKVFREKTERGGHDGVGGSLYFAAERGGMKRFLRARSGLQPASTVKPMEVAHYRVKHISEASPENVCVPHAAQYAYYDEPSRTLAERRTLNVCIPRHCSYAELVKGDAVEDWIRYTTHTPNDVIAGQHRCPLRAALGEFRAFGNLRSGINLQWANVLCQLVMPSLDFNKKETLALILQACLEVGPPQPDPEPDERAPSPSSIWREAHIDTQNESFMARILSAMRDALQRVRESWQNDIALCVLTCLATRLLSLSCSPDISSALVEYLGQLREVSIAWARLLLDKLNKSDKISDRQRWIGRLLRAALICGTTFNMGGEHLESVLSDSDNLSRLVESAVLARNHLPPSGRPTNDISLQLMQRWQTVMYRARHLVTKQVTDKGNQGLDRAIKHFWAEYSPFSSTSWTRLDSIAQSHILRRESGPVSITFNLLTGNLLLNGCPLSKLPASYRKHQSFVQLFGEQILDVGPSSVPGMEFSASRDQNGWVLHFAMMDSQLVVRAVRQTRAQGCGSDAAVRDELQLDSWEYIPREHLANDLANSFVNEYAHWLHLPTGKVEFRPINRRWESTPENWCLTRENHKHVLRKGSRVVIDPSSPTAVLSHRILGRIETFANINVILDRHDNSLALELPRLSLSFQVRQGETTVQSKNYNGMQIDKSQGIGSLVGLVDKLVLKPGRGPGFRMVLVPRGQVSSRLAKACSHVKVRIDCGDGKRLRHDAFLVDNKLGCLVGTGSLQSRLYICWLHALTSHCLPDPLTSRTGTEEALRVLQGAAVKSYPTLDKDSCELLAQIAKLSPPRTYYPSHLSEMERTAWDDAIPPLSQHDDFWPLAKSIFDDYEKSGKLFQPGCREADTTSAAEVFSAASEVGRSPTLAERARIRNAIFRVSEFGAEGHTTAEDTWYHPTDRATAGCQSRKAMVSRLVRCVDRGAEHLMFKPRADLTDSIVAVNSPKFSGNPKATIRFDLDNLRVPSRALKGLWCGLHRALVAEKNKYKKIFFLSSLLYAEGSDPEVVQTLMALSSISVFAQAEMLPPPDLTFDLDISRATLHDRLVNVTNASTKTLEECREYAWTKRHDESVRSFENRRGREWRLNSDAMASKFVDELQIQLGRSWTVAVPTNACYYRSYLDVDKIMPRVRDVAEMTRRSEAFHTYLTTLSRKLGEIGIMESCELGAAPSRTSDRPSSRPGLVSATLLFSQPAPPSDHPRPDLFSAPCTESQEPEKKHVHLSALVDELSEVGNLQGHQISYIDELRRSMASPAAPRHTANIPEGGLLSRNLQRAQERHDSIRHHLQLALTGTSIAHQLCHDAGVYPRISPIFLLQRLTRSFWGQLSRPWRRCLISLALSFVYLQRAERLDSHRSGLPERLGDLQRELSNPGDHENPEWDPLEYPESLLLEIEQGITIRPVQNKIAAVMRSPPGMKNSVMQLNMGEGKSSVIVPIVAAALANGKHLVRVVVAKPQSNQMTHMLISRLGGLMNRRVFYLPFSRSIQLSHYDVTAAREMMDKCRTEGGVLLVQPEHLLSFKLMGIDKSLAMEEKMKKKKKNKKKDGKTLGEEITGLHRYFESISRDIVDESDENFTVKFELIYTMGAQEPVEMSPDRWILIQQLLDLTETVVHRLMAAEKALPEVTEGLLVKDNEELAAEVCRRGLKGFPIHHQTRRMRQAVLSYILLDQVPGEDIKQVEDANPGFFSAVKDALLLLRGLLAKGVLLFALGQKRFRVNYGLAPDRQPRTTLAVPYRAKDMPSPRSEFSHPDVVIVLTCLSYYYSGLSDEQLYTCFELLDDSDQAEQEYARWAAMSPCLLPSFRHFSSINVEDKPQCESVVFPALRYARPAVEFYLGKVVFPKEMKQFPHKLSSSGWDLAKAKNHPLTGFSGTNDSKGVLPLSVAALDLQPHTNAAVLSTILGDENTVLELGGGRRESPLSALTEEMLLGALVQSEPPIRVILDVGAQVIESSNLQMAKKLLASVPLSSAEAAIFFNDQDELSVVVRSGHVAPFLTSPFATRTDRCLVFLDQAHTRGTDLRLPDDYRAAVTLGPGVTKDTMVQACMRMRKLGQGQSVSFVVSREMQRRIRAVRSVADEQPLTVADVIAWAISETWDEAVRSVPLWAAQGTRHIGQEAIWQRAESQRVFSSSHAREYLEPEAACLDKRYRPRRAATTAGGSTEIAALMASLDLEDQPDPGEAAKRDTQMSAIREKLVSFARATRTSTSTGTSAASSKLQEEQERELAPEVEEERHVHRPPPRKALPHSFHKDLVQFVRTGHVKAGSPAFGRPFLAMSTTSAASLFRPGLAAFPSDLLITKDFARTVEETGPSYRSDSYQRGVQWVLVSSARTRDDEEEKSWGSARMVLVSQWEASRLKGVIEKLQQELGSEAAAAEAVPPVTLHAYLPRPSPTFPPMEHLKTYTIPTLEADWEAPPDLVMQLNLFAGQLYLRSYDEYQRLCGYLGLVYTENDDEATAVPPDGFVGKKKYPECEFESSPVAFLAKVYNEIRGDCVGGIEKTHMGKILAGDILTEKDFFQGEVHS